MTTESEQRQAEAALEHAECSLCNGMKKRHVAATDTCEVCPLYVTSLEVAMFYLLRAAATPAGEAEPQHLGARITDPLPPAVECCECGHPKQWHSKAGWCRMALDIGEECPCRCYAMKMTLLIESRASSPAPTELDGADGVVGSET